MKVTDPVGVGEPDLDVTVAVKVTLPPVVTLLALGLSAVVVEIRADGPVPVRWREPAEP